MADPAISDPAVCLYLGQTTHKRFAPFEQSFSYRLCLLSLDIDQLEEADRASPLFNIDRAGLFSFRRRDHGARKDQPLRPWAENIFRSAGIDLGGGPIRLVTLPTHMFYKFAPISLWYGYGFDKALKGIIYEVNNTFGDTHAYIAAMGGARSQHNVQKQLYVSPFFDVSGAYRFTARPPKDTLSLVIENMDDGACRHMANIKARSAPATSSAFLKAAITRPLATHMVSAGIHWEALKLWIRGAGYRSRPEAPARPHSVATSAHAITERERYKLK